MSVVQGREGKEKKGKEGNVLSERASTNFVELMELKTNGCLMVDRVGQRQKGLDNFCVNNKLLLNLLPVLT